MATARRFGPHAVLFVVSATAVVPLWIMLAGAFKTNSAFANQPLAPPSSLSLDGFRSALTEEFGRWFLNSVILTGTSVGLVLVLAATAAWGFARWSFKGRDALLTGVVSLMVIPPVVLVVPLFDLGSELDLIGTYQYVILIYVAFMLPFSVYLLTSFFRTIPAPLIEAAVVDGARSLAVFRRVVLPLSKAPLITLAVVNVIWVWNELLIALVFLNDDAHRTLMVGVTGFQSRHNLNVPTIMAGLSVVSVPVIALYLFGQRFFVRGLVAGAVKE